MMSMIDNAAKAAKRHAPSNTGKQMVLVQRPAARGNIDQGGNGKQPAH